MAKILLVEDDINLLTMYTDRLRAEGYDIVTARDGEEALTIAVKEKPDLIISDVMMPKISGFDMLDILRSTPETKDAKVIMMTALSQAEDRERAERLGSDRYLVKSQVTLDDVAKIVNEVIASVAPAGGVPAVSTTPTAPVSQPTESTTPTAVDAPAPAPIIDMPVAATPAMPAPTPSMAMPTQAPSPQPVVDLESTTIPTDFDIPITQNDSFATPAAPAPVDTPTPVTVAPSVVPEPDYSAVHAPAAASAVLMPEINQAVETEAAESKEVGDQIANFESAPAVDAPESVEPTIAAPTPGAPFQPSTDAAARPDRISDSPLHQVVITPPSFSKSNIHDLYEKELAAEAARSNGAMEASAPVAQSPAPAPATETPATSTDNFTPKPNDPGAISL